MLPSLIHPMGASSSLDWILYSFFPSSTQFYLNIFENNVIRYMNVFYENVLTDIYNDIKNSCNICCHAGDA